jgi:hypothetical protein
MTDRFEPPLRTRSATTESLKQQLGNLKRSVAPLGHPGRTAVKVRIVEIEQELLSRGVDPPAPAITDGPAAGPSVMASE